MNIKIASGGAAYGTKVTTADGAEVGGLTAITFRAQVGDINRAELELAVGEIEVEAKARIFVRGKQVLRIDYADGTFDEFPAD